MFRHARIAIASLLFIGCGSSAAPKDAGVGGAGGRPVNFDGGAGLTGTGGAGGTPSPMPTGSLVFQGSQASLLDLGPPCTWEAGATGDRWCGFIAASVSV